MSISRLMFPLESPTTIVCFLSACMPSRVSLQPAYELYCMRRIVFQQVHVSISAKEEKIRTAQPMPCKVDMLSRILVPCFANFRVLGRGQEIVEDLQSTQ